MELEIDKKFIDDAVQRAVADIKQNFVPLSVIEDIKSEIKAEIDKHHSDGKYSYDTSRSGLRKALEIIDKHISGKENG